MAWTLIPASSLMPTPWRNGHGTSHEIASQLGPGGWTVSLATLERDAPFSHYPHADRVFTPIAGDPPPLLSFDGGPFEPCPLLVPRRFPGDIPVLSRIPAPGRAFNVIVDRRHWRAEVSVWTGSMPDPSGAILFVHCLSGQFGLAHPGDTLRHDGPDAAPLTHAGTALLIELRPL